ncbi:YbhB/YbcL family Raf kinase inhibitor-like protein [Geomonas sp.]|uniref:YbhB/YbcL family Raf kinase inhibitor-like protein n=1 Tax=Geomonas sp. TaxID=2651584 RepID=UPI002B49D614|nr:YbhB/YbcL family Raf kinase inhibitor-like protein [Geomonas sp.]HJV35934.1 YbhB/YbcL family Raf kinase inhibitor-like protein [Geomonas sp.]
MSRITKATLLLLPVLLLLAISSLPAKEVKRMNLSSPEFAKGQPIPAKYSCKGDDVNPPLVIEGVPAEAKALALIMDDPDAPVGTWVHWVMWNIEPSTKQIAQSSVPAGAQQGINSWKRNNYGGPCPPSGTHRYFFKLYALKERLDLPASTTSQQLEHAMHGKVLAQCELMGTFSH